MNKTLNTSRPCDEFLIELLGGARYNNMSFTSDQVTKLKEFYGFVDDSEDGAFIQSTNNRNLFRHTEHDGLRIMAFLAKFLVGDEEKDPVRFLENLMDDIGFDVGMGEWDEEEGNED